MNLGQFHIGDTIVFPANTHNTSAVSTDATGSPAYRVYEMTTNTPLVTGSMAKLDDANTVGLYAASFDATALLGFEENKTYIIHMAATVQSKPGTSSHVFQIVPSYALEASVQTVKGKTDNLPALPAAVGSQMDLVNAPNSTAIAAIQSGLSLEQTVQLVKLVTDKVLTMLVQDADVWKFTQNALEENAVDLSSVIGGGGDTLETISNQLDGVQADLDNPDQYKADVSNLAKPGDAMNLVQDYDAAKTAAQAGAQMDLLPATLSSIVDAMPPGITLEEIEGSTHLAMAGSQMDLLPNTLGAIVDAMPPGITLEEIEGSAVLAKEATLDSILLAISSIDVSSQVLAAIVEGDLTIQDILRVALAVLSGVSGGSGTTEVYFKDSAGVSNIVVATLDRKGNRTEVVLNV